MTLHYDENIPRDCEKFAEMIADLQAKGARFDVERRAPALLIIIQEAQ